MCKLLQGDLSKAHPLRRWVNFLPTAASWFQCQQLLLQEIQTSTSLKQMGMTSEIVSRLVYAQTSSER